MSSHSNTNDGINIRRATVFAYIQLLFGVFLLARNLETWLTDASLSWPWSWVLLNVLVVVSVFIIYLNPDTVGAGDETASNYLLVAALVASVVTFIGISSLLL